jgi:hypothetical protein
MTFLLIFSVLCVAAVLVGRPICGFFAGKPGERR